jgi:hypothetical protein
MCLDEHTLEIELPKQLLEHSSFVVLAGCEAGLGDGHAKGGGVQSHLGDECGTTAAGGLDRATQSPAVTDQLIEVACPAWDLGDGPIPDSAADSRHIHL